MTSYFAFCTGCMAGLNLISNLHGCENAQYNIIKMSLLSVMTFFLPTVHSLFISFFMYLFIVYVYCVACSSSLFALSYFTLTVTFIPLLLCWSVSYDNRNEV